MKPITICYPRHRIVDDALVDFEQKYRPAQINEYHDDTLHHSVRVFEARYATGSDMHRGVRW